MRRSICLLAFLIAPAFLSAQATSTATFTGSVVDSVQRPIANAEVSLPGVSLSATTAENGTFRLAGIPAGIHRVIVRRIGYGQLDTLIIFG